ncbi:MAG: dephospho-CoA kinase [Desulfuromonadaceae bacterium]|nr:dephospho-CoA kinase [Desulfuromonadaceae bacterium]
MILGVTGGIASGKSTVTKLLAQQGAEVVSADQLSRELVEPGSAVLAQLVACFGEGILDGEGRLNRAALGARVFADAVARKQLEAIMHPAIAVLSRQRLHEAQQRAALVVYEAPLLYEAHAEDRVDRVLTVTVDPAVQLARLLARDRCSEQEARNRIGAQMPQEEKARRADYVLDNSSDLMRLKDRVDAFYRQLAADIIVADRS